MEIIIVILIIGLLFYLGSKRFQGFVRNTFFLDAVDQEALKVCSTGDMVVVRGIMQRNRLVVEKDGHYFGLVPDDYFNLIKRHIPDKGKLTGTIISLNDKVCKVKFDLSPVARDMLG